MAPQTPRHERHRPSPTYWGAIHNGTKPIRPTSAPSAKKNPYFNAKYIGYDPSGGRKFDFSRLDKMSPLYRPSPGEEQNEEDCRERMRRAREMLSPYMDHYRALPRSSVLSKELTKQLGQQLVEEQWKYASTDGQSLFGQNP